MAARITRTLSGRMDCMNETPSVTIFTDGASEPNPGPSGYGVVLLFGDERKELSQGFVASTNNRMELLAVIVGLEALKRTCKATVYSDSKYVVDAVVQNWVFNWRDKNWKRRKGGPIKNLDLWKRFLHVFEKHDVDLQWVKGHSGVKENERCDQLAVEAAASPHRIIDDGYEAGDSDTKPTQSQRPRTRSKGNKTHKNEGEPCRKCSTPIVKRTRSKPKKQKKGKTYYFEWFFFCPGCETLYMVDEAKRYYDTTKQNDSSTSNKLFD